MDDDSEISSPDRNIFADLLRYEEDFQPIQSDLRDEQRERRKLDALRIERNIMYIDRINSQLDTAVKERIESDQLIDKLSTTRLDAMQRKLVRQIEAGFQALQDELEEAKERLRIATEKLYQQEVDAETQLEQMRTAFTSESDRVQEVMLKEGQLRLQEDLQLRANIPAPILEVWRATSDERDAVRGLQSEARERLLPLEHSELNDVESTVAQKRIRQELKELIDAIQKETFDRISEERAQAAKSRAYTDALARGLKIVNRTKWTAVLPSPIPSPKKSSEINDPDDDND